MSDPRTRHGSYAGYQRGCRQECCRAAARDYQRQRYLDHVVLGLPPRCVPKIGSERRVHALQALGWSAEALSARLGYSRAYLNVAINRPERRGIHWDTARRIADLYDGLSMTLPPQTICTERQKRAARNKGWLPPLAWDDETIDDPDALPNMPLDNLRLIGGCTDIDPVVVERILAGDWTLRANLAERLEVIRRWTGSDGELVRLTRWNVNRDRRRTSEPRDGAA